MLQLLLLNCNFKSLHCTCQGSYSNVWDIRFLVFLLNFLVRWSPNFPVENTQFMWFSKLRWTLKTNLTLEQQVLFIFRWQSFGLTCTKFWEQTEPLFGTFFTNFLVMVQFHGCYFFSWLSTNPGVHIPDT